MKFISTSAVILGPIIRIMNEIMPKPKYFLSRPARSFSKMMIHAKEWQGVCLRIKPKPESLSQ